MRSVPLLLLSVLVGTALSACTSGPRARPGTGRQKLVAGDSLYAVTTPVGAGPAPPGQRAPKARTAD